MTAGSLESRLETQPLVIEGVIADTDVEKPKFYKDGLKHHQML